MTETPEQRARRDIDADLATARLVVQDRKDLDLSAGRGIAQRVGRAANGAKRTPVEPAQGVDEWVHTKYKRPEKVEFMRSLWNGDWSSELVLNVVKSPDEVALIEGKGVRVLRLKDIVSSFASTEFPVKSASGADFIDLIQMGAQAQETDSADRPIHTSLNPAGRNNQ